MKYVLLIVLVFTLGNIDGTMPPCRRGVIVAHRRTKIIENELNEATAVLVCGSIKNDQLAKGVFSLIVEATTEEAIKKLKSIPLSPNKDVVWLRVQYVGIYKNGTTLAPIYTIITKED